MARLQWDPIVAQAASIVESYATPVTLRQLFYRLVAAEVLGNTQNNYKTLSSRTAEARRRGAFPALVDRTRTIHRHTSFSGPVEAARWLSAIYRRDRTEGQEWTVYVGVEKAGIVNQLEAWFGDLGVPVVALGGYSSQSYVDDVVEDVESEQRPAVLVYAGDFDPSGEDILRDFVARAGCFDKVERIALNAEQVIEYDLPPQMGKATDSRAGQFVARHGRLVQVELDALPPDVLRALYDEAIGRYWDSSAYEAVMEQEWGERASLVRRAAE